MRRENIAGVVRTTEIMDTITKPAKPHTAKHLTGLSLKPKSKEHGTVPRQRRYSLDIVSSKPITCHSHKDKDCREKVEDRRFSQRRYSLCTKLDNGKPKEKDIISQNRQSEMKSILKSGASSICNSVHSSEAESSTGSDDKQPSSDVKCSYRLPKETETGKLRKSVSFKEIESRAVSARRRFSSSAMDANISSNYSLSASTLLI
jgi:hypothetical protein